MTVTVFLESFDNEIMKGAKEAAGAAKQIANHLDTDLAGIMIDNDTSGAEDVAKTLGISKLYTKDGIEQYDSKLYADLILSVTEDSQVVVFPRTAWSGEISGFVGTKSDRTPVTDIVGVESGNSFVRSIHGNSILATVEADGNLLVTVRTGAFDVPEESGDVELVEIDADGEPSPTKIVNVEVEESEEVPLPEADRIVAGGRGTQDPETYQEHIGGLAELIDATTGATRAIVDDGWVPTHKQIGQTGATVSPSLYFAAGISGAVQHISGMKTSDVIISINTDPEAPIFDISDFGIVADLREVIPVLREKIQAKRAES